MKRCMIIALLPFFLYSCIVVKDDVRVMETESRDFSASQIRKVEVETKNGKVESIVSEDDSIHVEFERSATGSGRGEAEDNLDDIKIYIDRDTTSGVLSIDVDMPSFSWGGTDYGCNVFLSLPSSLSLDLSSSNGSIRVSESQNDVECSTSNGAITLQDTSGDAELRTSNGKITVVDHYGKLTGRTSNGEIDADIILPAGGECILKTSNGSITLSIPDETSAMIKASTSNGEVEIRSLDVTIIKKEKKEFEGEIGDGEGDIELETSNGNILIRKR